MSDDAFVELCTCPPDGVSAQAIRAALEARGIGVVVQGGHTHDMLGGLYGAGMSPRVLVRPNDLADAQAIAEEIVGELDIEPAPAEERTLPGDPHRPRPREDDDDALASLWEDDDQADEPSPPKPKQLALPVLVAFLGLAFGLSHFYVGRNRLGGLIAVTAVVGLYLFVAGNPLGGWLYALAWCADLFGGCIGVAQYNRRIGGPRALPQGITRTGLPS